MGAIEDEKVYGLTIRESADDGSDFTNPPADYRRLFVGEDGLFHLKDSAGTVTTPGGSTDLDAIITASSGQDIADALAGAAAPDAGNVFATMADVGVGSGLTIVRPALTPGSPTDDFEAALSGWTAVSNAGSFSLTKVFAQAENGSRLWMPFANQHGYIYQTTTNIDQEWIVGGLISGPRTADFFPGIAILDSSGNGAAAIYHVGDNTIALISVTAGLFDTASAQIITSKLLGVWIGTGLPIWIRLTRVGNTWDMWASITGNAREYHVAATISKTITASRKAIGVFSASAISTSDLVIQADWVNTV